MDNDSDSDVGDILTDLLANDTEDVQESVPKKTLEELDFNFLDSVPKEINENKPANQQNKSEVYDDTIDSSDDEDRRHFEEQKYSDYGRDIKSLLKKDPMTKTEDKPVTNKKSHKAFDFNDIDRSKTGSNNNNFVAAKDVYSDPFFGLRIINPLVSSVELKARMNGKIAVTVAKAKFHVHSDKTDSDWVIAGVLINKSATKTSQKGSSYAIWKLSDLSDNINTVCVFLFSNAYKGLWKTTVGTVIGILNPNVLESKDNTDLATLSVDNPQKVMVLGKSKDMGKCRATKKNGEPCSSVINISRCEFCVYHIKQEYKKCSRRAELQAFSNTQRFSIDMLKRKGEQPKPPNNAMPTFNAVYAVKSHKLQAKDAKRLAMLSGTCNPVEKGNCIQPVHAMNDKTARTELGGQKLKSDFEKVNNSRGWRAAMLIQSSNEGVLSPSFTSSKTSANQKSVQRTDNSMLSSLSSRPRLGAGCIGGTIDLSEPITKKHINVAKSNAIRWVKENGKIKAQDPNKVKLNKEDKVERGKKRPRDAEQCEEQEAKKTNALPEKFKEMMQAKSAHTDLIEKSYEQEKEKYFNKLEMKERMEEKMLSTYKVPCKAVRCLTCKYTSFSASDVCKEQKHPLRVAEATKRFFKCADCGNRTVSLDRIPSHSCKKCSGSNWTRAAMMDERKTNVAVATLSIRGDEESHLGLATKDANLNLLVPENDEKR